MIFKIETKTKQFRFFANRDVVNLNFIEGFFRVSDEVRKYLMDSTGKNFSPDARFTLKIECKDEKYGTISGVMNGTINGTIIDMERI